MSLGSDLTDPESLHDRNRLTTENVNRYISTHTLKYLERLGRDPIEALQVHLEKNLWQPPKYEDSVDGGSGSTGKSEKRKQVCPIHTMEEDGSVTTGTGSSRTMSQYVLASKCLLGWGRPKRAFGTIIHPPHFFPHPSNPSMTQDDMDIHIDRMAYGTLPRKLQGIIKPPPGYVAPPPRDELSKQREKKDEMTVKAKRQFLPNLMLPDKGRSNVVINVIDPSARPSRQSSRTSQDHFPKMKEGADQTEADDDVRSDVSDASSVSTATTRTTTTESASSTSVHSVARRRRSIQNVADALRQLVNAHLQVLEPGSRVATYSKKPKQVVVRDLGTAAPRKKLSKKRKKKKGEDSLSQNQTPELQSINAITNENIERVLKRRSRRDSKQRHGINLVSHGRMSTLIARLLDSALPGEDEAIRKKPKAKSLTSNVHLPRHESHAEEMLKTKSLSAVQSKYIDKLMLRMRRDREDRTPPASTKSSKYTGQRRSSEEMLPGHGFSALDDASGAFKLAIKAKELKKIDREKHEREEGNAQDAREPSDNNNKDDQYTGAPEIKTKQPQDGPHEQDEQGQEVYQRPQEPVTQTDTVQGISGHKEISYRKSFDMNEANYMLRNIRRSQQNAHARVVPEGSSLDARENEDTEDTEAATKDAETAAKTTVEETCDVKQSELSCIRQDRSRYDYKSVTKIMKRYKNDEEGEVQDTNRRKSALGTATTGKRLSTGGQNIQASTAELGINPRSRAPSQTVGPNKKRKAKLEEELRRTNSDESVDGSNLRDLPSPEQSKSMDGRWETNASTSMALPDVDEELDQRKLSEVTKKRERQNGSRQSSKQSLPIKGDKATKSKSTKSAKSQPRASPLPQPSSTFAEVKKQGPTDTDSDG